MASFAQYLGDGVLAYFGYPEAHEQAAEQATRASLELQAVLAVASRNSDRAETRIGIATGCCGRTEPLWLKPRTNGRGHHA